MRARGGGGLSPDAKRILAVQALRAFAYGLGSVLIGVSLEREGLSGPMVGVVLGSLLAGSAIVSVLLARYGDRIVADQVGDSREPTRSWCDRMLPGDGAIDFDRVLGVLEEAGWDGFYELEIFSDDGTFGDAFEDSLWKTPAAELAERGRQAFESVGVAEPSKVRSAYASHSRRRQT